MTAVRQARITAAPAQVGQSATTDREKSDTNANHDDPFNHYNRQFVKLDANRWLDDPVDGEKMIHLDGLHFGLLGSSERQAELFAKLAPDSVNVNYPHQLTMNNMHPS